MRRRAQAGRRAHATTHHMRAHATTHTQNTREGGRTRSASRGTGVRNALHPPHPPLHTRTNSSPSPSTPPPPPPSMSAPNKRPREARTERQAERQWARRAASPEAPKKRDVTCPLRSPHPSSTLSDAPRPCVSAHASPLAWGGREAGTGEAEGGGDGGAEARGEGGATARTNARVRSACRESSTRRTQPPSHARSPSRLHHAYTSSGPGPAPGGVTACAEAWCAGGGRVRYACAGTEGRGTVSHRTCKGCSCSPPRPGP